MKNSEYRKGSKITIFDFIKSNQIVSDALKIGGRLLWLSEQIEGFCVFAALSKSDPKVAVDFMQQMYPREQASVWQWSMTKFGQRFGNIDAMRQLIQMIDL